jgi:hypothetical protein
MKASSKYRESEQRNGKGPSVATVEDSSRRSCQHHVQGASAPRGTTLASPSTHWTCHCAAVFYSCGQNNLAPLEPSSLKP